MKQIKWIQKGKDRKSLYDYMRYERRVLPIRTYIVRFIFSNRIRKPLFRYHGPLKAKAVDCRTAQYGGYLTNLGYDEKEIYIIKNQSSPRLTQAIREEIVAR